MLQDSAQMTVTSIAAQPKPSARDIDSLLQLTDEQIASGDADYLVRDAFVYLRVADTCN